MTTHLEEVERCKAYTEAKGQYASFFKGERCKRKAKINGYCTQHHKQQELLQAKELLK